MFGYIFIVIFIVSVLLALRSMGDMGQSREVKTFLKERKIKGAIIFMKDKVIHYSSSSSSSS